MGMAEMEERESAWDSGGPLVEEAMLCLTTLSRLRIKSLTTVKVAYDFDEIHSLMSQLSNAWCRPSNQSASIAKHQNVSRAVIDNVLLMFATIALVLDQVFLVSAILKTLKS
jgi:Asp-tRNA(Asn)/Glu-tRNA(Gln) amidotransferase C subunit